MKKKAHLIKQKSTLQKVILIVINLTLKFTKTSSFLQPKNAKHASLLQWKKKKTIPMMKAKQTMNLHEPQVLHFISKMTYLTSTSLTYFFQTSDAFIARRIFTGSKIYTTTFIKLSVDNPHMSQEQMQTTGNGTNGKYHVHNQVAMAGTPLTGPCGCI